MEYGAGRPGVTESDITRMRDRMPHRGPDDAGVYVTADRRVGLGHRRLSIVDLSPAGHNPMPNETGRIWITFNGEIYNHGEFRDELIGRGHTYRSRTDTETIVHLYEEYGLDFVHKLDGDFAIAIWDEDRGRLVLARDPIGVKPLYYYHAGGRLIFASEIKAILAHPAVPREVDEEALYHYLTFLTTPAPGTLFSQIQKLPAGCMLTCDSRGEVNVKRYWDATTGGRLEHQGEQQLTERLGELLDQSIQKRMMSDVPFGVFLSGGVDSTANVALMARSSAQPVRTFTVGFSDNLAYSEMEEARAVARRYGTDHHEVMIGHKEFVDFLPDLIFHQDEPIADPVCVPLYYVSRLARQSGVTVVQVGEGADELFCGYRDYVYYLKFYDRFWRHASRLPAPLRRAAAESALAAYRAAAPLLPGKLEKVVPGLLRRLAAGEELFLSGTVVFDDEHKRNLLAPEFRKSLFDRAGGHLSSNAVARADLERLLAARPEAGQLERMTYQDLKLRLAELLLMRVDKITMATSVEARVPFLDRSLVEFAMSLPRHMKYRHGETKYLLKRALRDVIPESVLSRKKKGFAVPINEWIFGRMGSFVENALLNSPLRRRGFFDYDYVKRLLAEHRSGRVNYSFHLWSLLNLSLWYERWIDRQEPAASSPPPVEMAAGHEASVNGR